MSKVTFRVYADEDRQPGDNVVTKTLIVKMAGEAVAFIHSRINDLNQDYSNPGYSVTVWVESAEGKTLYRDNSGSFQNRGIIEAKENRSRYTQRCKDFCRERYS